MFVVQNVVRANLDGLAIVGDGILELVRAVYPPSQVVVSATPVGVVVGFVRVKLDGLVVLPNSISDISVGHHAADSLT